ncbi:P1 family peptidase [Aminipila luticellarii]|uniref:S58 family peptidase n=1 Tax=Aminipila luticellarii TaxID=2507160 RepID=A0A410PVN9_9FIRM|nr:P1 family peptidase [Aminipila luticellarii]QAT42978.1 S58 family peptidase [Aminipila luticellarii]
MGLPKDCEVSIRCKFKKGERNLITDVPGVKVGHVTLIDQEKDIHTGVTAILPHTGNLFKNKVLAATSVINGFGKSTGLVQIDELGNIETPIIMTNTFGVGTALNAVTKYMMKENEDIGTTTGTVNCVVTECNDGELNDIRGMHVTEEDVLQAIENCGDVFEEGVAGSGSGMICMGIKGGIGSASRIVPCDGKDYTIGAILMSNFGMSGNLMIDGRRIDTEKVPKSKAEKGSVIIIIGTDLPLNERQLRRVAKRATVALCRTGSFLGNGSGDIAVAFSNTNIMPHYSEKNIIETKMFHDDAIDKIFEATAEVVEEAVVSSIYHAENVKGIRGKEVFALKEFL